MSTFYMVLLTHKTQIGYKHFQAKVVVPGYFYSQSGLVRVLWFPTNMEKSSVVVVEIWACVCVLYTMWKIMLTTAPIQDIVYGIRFRMWPSCSILCTVHLMLMDSVYRMMNEFVWRPLFLLFFAVVLDWQSSLTFHLLYCVVDVGQCAGTG